MPYDPRMTSAITCRYCHKVIIHTQRGAWIADQKGSVVKCKLSPSTLHQPSALHRP